MAFSAKTFTGARTNTCVNCMNNQSRNTNTLIMLDSVRPISHCELSMPNEDFKLNFTKREKTQKCSFVVYADFEALNVSGNIKKGTKTYHWRIYPASYGAILIDRRTNSVVAKSFDRGKDCIIELMNNLLTWSAWCDLEHQRFKRLSDVLSAQQLTHAAKGAKCCICEEVVQDCPVIHHCQSTGKSFGIAHLKSNLPAKQNASFQFLSQSLEVWCSPYCEATNYISGWEPFSISRTDEVHISFSLRIKVSLYTCKYGIVVPL